MNQNFNQLQVRFPGLGCWLFILGAAWLIGAIGLSGIIKSIVVLVLLIFLVPVLAFFALQFWIKRNLITGNCPVCEQPLTSLKGLQTPCPNCGTAVSATREGFVRFATDGVIDVQVVDVRPNRKDLADGNFLETDATTIDVEVQQLPDADR